MVGISTELAGQRGTRMMRTERWMCCLPGTLLEEADGGRGIINELVHKAER